MTSATFTTLLSTEITNDYGNTYKVSLIHQGEGNVAAGSASVFSPELWHVRVVQAGQSTFHGRQFRDKLAALDFYNLRAGTAANVVFAAA